MSRDEILPAKFDMDSEKFWDLLFYQHMNFHSKDPYELYSVELQRYGKLDSFNEYCDDIGYSDDVKLAGYCNWVKVIDSKRGKMIILKLSVDNEDVNIVAWNSFYSNSPIRNLTEEEIVGKFILVFGKKDQNPQGEDQVQLSNYGDDLLEIL